jgi:hypothetical protein
VRNGVNTTPENAPVVEADELPDPVLADNPDADTGEDTLPGDALTSNTELRWRRDLHCEPGTSVR